MTSQSNGPNHTQELSQICHKLQPVFSELEIDFPGIKRPRSLNDMDNHREYCLIILHFAEAPHAGFVFDLTGTGSSEEERTKNYIKLQQKIRVAINQDCGVEYTSGCHPIDRDELQQDKRHQLLW